MKPGNFSPLAIQYRFRIDEQGTDKEKSAKNDQDQNGKNRFYFIHLCHQKLK